MSVSFENNMIHLAREKDALYIAQKLHAAGEKLFTPTDEQAAIINSKHWGPTIVIAGAGSGKTETMSQRVLWLVANGVVKPSEILGLTFTRKAAGELSTRIRKRLRQLQSIGELPLDAETGLPLDLTVDVSTYHSYAGRVLSDHGIRMGVDAQAAPLGEAAAWMAVQQLVLNADQREFPFEHDADWVVKQVLALSAAIGEHGTSIDEVRRVTRDLLEKFLVVPPDNEGVRSTVRTLKERLELLYLVEQSDTARFTEGRFTFNDQMSLAAKLVNELRDISAIEQAKYKVVLLDEYQDTSQSQIRFLSALFGDDFPITAVGDPNQAIYGWRGASSGTLRQFGTDFRASVNNLDTYDLLTSWRNDVKILDFANLVIENAGEKFGAAISVKSLRARPGAGAGALEAARYLTMEDEALGIAEHIAEKWHSPDRLALAEEKRSTFAVLVATKKYIPEIEFALRERGVPTEVIGLAGLIQIPEVAEIIALLRAAVNPQAGVALAQLIAGPRIALGPKDIRGLGRFARKITDGSSLGKSSTLEKILFGGASSVMEGDDFAVGSIIDALDRIDEAPADYFSREGVERLKEFNGELREFRKNIGGSVVDAILEAERFLRLDVEVLVRDGWLNGRHNLDAFLREAANFQRSGGSLSAFLDWLKVAEEQERGLQADSVVESKSAVQILTIHGSKGAEWDYVYIPGIVKDNLPGKQQASSDPVANAGAIPVTLRGDRNELGFDFEMPDLQAPKLAPLVSKAVEQSKARWNELYQAEQYRLAYVAFTRARLGIFGTSTHFKSGKKAVNAGEFFDLLDAHISKTDSESFLHREEFIELDEKGDEILNPLRENPKRATWPKKLAITDEIRASAASVKSAEAFSESHNPTNAEEESFITDANLLLKEIADRRSPEVVYLPSRLSVSTMISLKKDPEALALNLRRPMPNFSNPFARKGTAFHEWIEKYFDHPVLFDDEILDPHALPEESDPGVEKLKEQWLVSEWAKRNPFEVECPFETVLAGTVVKGRIDAVYRCQGDDGEYLYDVVDWKTGKELDGADFDDAAIQLAMYRLAYSKLHNIPLDRISAAFFYIPANVTKRPVDLMDEAELLSVLEAIPLIEGEDPLHGGDDR